jgi:asparagine synthase (glutamine-hydrolysing)
LFERPKLGFGVPLGEWLRGPLRDWSENLLSVPALSQDGLLNPHPIRRAWQDHVAGRVDWKYWLWPVLMLQAWRQSMTDQESHLHESRND